MQGLPPYLKKRRRGEERRECPLLSLPFCGRLVDLRRHSWDKQSLASLCPSSTKVIRRRKRARLPRRRRRKSVSPSLFLPVDLHRRVCFSRLSQLASVQTDLSVSLSRRQRRESDTDRNNGRKNKRSSRSGLKTRRRLLQPKQTEVLRGRERKRKEEEESAVGLHVWARYAPPAFLDIG